MAINKRGEGAALSENNIARRGRWLLWHYGKYNYKAALDPTDETVTSHARGLGKQIFGLIAGPRASLNFRQYFLLNVNTYCIRLVLPE